MTADLNILTDDETMEILYRFAGIGIKDQVFIRQVEAIRLPVANGEFMRLKLVNTLNGHFLSLNAVVQHHKFGVEKWGLPNGVMKNSLKGMVKVNRSNIRACIEELKGLFGSIE